MTIAVRFRDMGIGTKLAFLVGFLIAAIAIFILLYFPARQENDDLERLAEKGQSIADMTAFTIGPALVFDDWKTLQESFAAAKQNKGLAFLVLLSDHGRIVHAYNAHLTDSSETQNVPEGGAVSSNGMYYLVGSSIWFERKEIGRLCVGLSLEELKQEAKDTRFQIGLVSAVVFLVGVLSVMLIGTIITVPLRRMVTVAHEVAGGNLAVRAVSTSRDEAGLLAETFNSMMEKLSVSHHELENMNRTLELRVENRTRKLKEAEEKYRSIFENAVAGIYQTTMDGRFVIANPTLANILGYSSADELVAAGVLAQSFYVRSGRRNELITAVQLKGTLSGFESQIRLKDQTVKWISETAKIVRGSGGAALGLEGTVVDISKRKQAEEETQRLLSAVEQTDEVIMMTNVDGTISYVNPAFERLYGYSKLEAIGRTPRILKSGAHNDDYYKSLWREIVSGVSYHDEHVNRAKNGDLVTVSAAINPVYDTSKELSGFISVQSDVSNRKREEEQRKHLEDQLTQAQKMESIGTLAGGIAHDFNNILAIILGHVGLLQRKAGDPERLASSLKSINAAVNRGAGLVRQILTFARKTDVLLEPVNLNEIVTELAGMLKETFPKTITFTSTLESSNPVIEADRTQIHQTLLNLFVNARDAMPKGGSLRVITRELDADSVRKRFPEAGDSMYVIASVTDTGSGMNRATMERIFEPFFTTKEKGKGTGLGLSVVHGIVKNHRGFVDVQSTVGSGTTFSLYFPIVRSETPRIETGIYDNSANGGNETILVVEDEDMLKTLLESLLTTNGYKVLIAEDGEKAVEAYQKHQQDIALVVTDIGLPKMGGEDVFMRIRTINPYARVILASGYIEPHVRSELMKHGARRIINKPYVPQDFLKQIREVLDQPHSIA